MTFSKTTKANEYILFITDQLFKLTQAIPAFRTIAVLITNFFFDHWFIPHGVPAYILTDDDNQFVSKCFVMMCAYPGVKHLATTAYHTQTKGRAERLNETIIVCLQLYEAKSQMDWDTFLQPTPYAYRKKIYQSTTQALFRLVLSRPLPEYVLLQSNAAILSDTFGKTSPQVHSARLKARIRTLRAKVDAHT